MQMSAVGAATRLLRYRSCRTLYTAASVLTSALTMAQVDLTGE